MEDGTRKISEIKKEYDHLGEDMLDDFISEYVRDGRPGVARIVNLAQKRQEKLRIERERIFALSEFERKYSDYEYICGIDEVGRGPLAGPVVACGVILPKDCDILYINDSKKLTEKRLKTKMIMQVHDELIIEATDDEKDKSVRIIADHSRSAVFIIGDQKGVTPSNVGAGYVLRRLIRRAVRHGMKLGIDQSFLPQIAEAVIENFKCAYPELEENAEKVKKELAIFALLRYNKKKQTGGYYYGRKNS